jgi:predicted aminopeptidase
MKLFLLSSLIFLSSCAKFGYITEQGIGQVSLEWNGESNEDALKNKNISDANKKKIKDIQTYKKYFYNYLGVAETDIYDETTILKNDAVTYLVIISPENKIEAVKTKFPIVGSFPYLGFFKKSSALEYKKKKEKEGYATYMRPVYAYSTLNQWIFDDNILSSFFHYNERQLAELIFHELTHTVLFIKDEVEFNESFAQLIGREMAFEYFKYDNRKIEMLNISEQKNEKLLSKISELSAELSKKYLAQTFDYKKTLIEFQKSIFTPAIKKICIVEVIKNCWPLKGSWNNAKYAAFGTYQNKQSIIEEIKISKKFNIKELFKYTESKYQEYDDKDPDESFITFLKRKEKI